MKQKIKKTIEESIKQLRNNRLERHYTKKIKSIIKHIDSLKTIDDKAIKDYWSKFGFKVNTTWHQAYISVNGKFDENYITEPLFYNHIEPTLNDTRVMLAYSDKNSYSKILKNVDLPEEIIKNIKSNFYDGNNNRINVTEAKKILEDQEGQLIIKPSLETGGGRGVNLIELKNSQIYLNGDITSFEKLIEQYGNDFIVQRAVEQHKVMSEVYPHSLNTIRIMTFRHGDKINILSAVARFGNDGSVVDNQASGGVSCGVNEDGTLKQYALDKTGGKKLTHPFTGVLFGGIKIPNYKSICEKVKELHEQLPYFDLISWDVAVNKEGKVIIIELNLQSQEINFHQFNNGPLFGSFTEDIINKLRK